MHPRQSFVNRAPWRIEIGKITAKVVDEPSAQRHPRPRLCHLAPAVTGQWRQHSKTLDRFDAIVGDAVEPDPALHAGSPPWRQGGCATPISLLASGDCSARLRKSLPLLKANDIDEQNAYCRLRGRRRHIFNACSTRGKHVHQGHRVLAMLCRRGLGKRWATAHPPGDAPRDVPAYRDASQSWGGVIAWQRWNRSLRGSIAPSRTQNAQLEPSQCEGASVRSMRGAYCNAPPCGVWRAIPPMAVPFAIPAKSKGRYG